MCLKFVWYVCAKGGRYLKLFYILNAKREAAKDTRRGTLWIEIILGHLIALQASLAHPYPMWANRGFLVSTCKSSICPNGLKRSQMLPLADVSVSKIGSPCIMTYVRDMSSNFGDGPRVK